MLTKKLTLSNKVERISKVASLTRDNDAFLDVTGEAIYLAKLSRNLSEKAMISKEFLEKLVVSLETSEPISTMTRLEDSELFDVGTKLVQLHNGRLGIPMDMEKQKLIQELQTMRQQLCDTQSMLRQQEEENVGLQEKIEQQDAKLEELQTFKQDSFQLYKKYFKDSKADE